MIFPALLAKFLSASALAQAATGATVVVVAVTGAGATGVLGEDVQDTLTSVVAADDETGDPAVGTPVVATPTTTDPGVVPTTPAEPTGPAEPETEIDAAAFVAVGPAGYDSFGEWVSKCASDAELRADLRAQGISFGQVIRTWAHKKGVTDQDLAVEGVDLDDLDDDATGSATATPTATPDVESTDAGETSHGKGNGGGKGKENGNSGRGKH